MYNNFVEIERLIRADVYIMELITDNFFFLDFLKNIIIFLIVQGKFLEIFHTH